MTQPPMASLLDLAQAQGRHKYKFFFLFSIFIKVSKPAIGCQTDNREEAEFLH